MGRISHQNDLQALIAKVLVQLVEHRVLFRVSAPSGRWFETPLEVIQQPIHISLPQFQKITVNVGRLVGEPTASAARCKVPARPEPETAASRANETDPTGSMRAHSVSMPRSLQRFAGESCRVTKQRIEVCCRVKNQNPCGETWSKIHRSMKCRSSNRTFMPPLASMLAQNSPAIPAPITMRIVLARIFASENRVRTVVHRRPKSNRRPYSRPDPSHTRHHHWPDITPS